MRYIDPHVHMSSRVTDDYDRMAQSGCVLVSEPSFWPGFDRTSVDSFRDYFRLLTGFEPSRARRVGIQHWTWMCVNAKEAENLSLSRDVLAIIPEFLDRPNVLGIGEIGLHKNTRNETIIFREHLDLAAKTNELILIHTPHLSDKYKGTRMIIDMLNEHDGVQRDRVLVDHLEEHTIRFAKEAGFWCGLTMYPNTKCTPARAADIVERFGDDRIMVNSAADWGPSNPMAVAQFIQEMRRRGHSRPSIEKVVYENPLRFFRQARNFQFTAPE